MPYFQCAQCETSFYASPSVRAQGYGRYCSKTCSNIGSNPALGKRIPLDIEAKIIEAYQSGKSKQEAGQMFGYGRGGVAKILKRRGITPRTSGEQLKGRIFTDEHRQKIADRHANVSGKNNPMFGKTPGHGKHIFVIHLQKWVRSTWEARIACILHEFGIRHEYESHRIHLDENTTYLPDFYLPDHDMYIEVKGWYNDRAKRVLPRIASEHPNIRLLVIDQPVYIAITHRHEHLRALITS